MIKSKTIILIILIILLVIITTCFSFSQDSYCPKCGVKVNSGDIYCSKCGAKLSSSSSNSSNYSTSNLLNNTNWTKADVAYHNADKAGENWAKVNKNYVHVYHKGIGSRVKITQTVSIDDIKKLKFSCSLEAQTQGIGFASIGFSNNGVAAYLFIDYLDFEGEELGSSVIYVSNGVLSIQGYTGKEDTGHIFTNTPTQHIIEEHVSTDWKSLNKLSSKNYKIDIGEEVNVHLPELQAEDIRNIRIGFACTSNAEASAELIAKDIKLYYK